MVGIVRGLGGRKMRALLGPAESLQSWDPAVFGLKASQLDSETGFSSLSLVQGHGAGLDSLLLSLLAGGV